MIRHTKDYNHEIVLQLVELMKDYDTCREDSGERSDWIAAVVPYSQDWLLEYLEYDICEHIEAPELIYEAAISVSVERLSYLIDYINKYISYQDQFDSYADIVESVDTGNECVIVTTLASKLGKSLVDLDLTSTKFNVWRENVLNGQV